MIYQKRSLQWCDAGRKEIVGRIGDKTADCVLVERLVWWWWCDAVRKWPVGTVWYERGQEANFILYERLVVVLCASVKWDGWQERKQRL